LWPTGGRSSRKVSPGTEPDTLLAPLYLKQVVTLLVTAGRVECGGGSPRWTQARGTT
jgi:hypothetical protein